MEAEDSARSICESSETERPVRRASCFKVSSCVLRASRMVRPMARWRSASGSLERPFLASALRTCRWEQPTSTFQVGAYFCLVRLGALILVILEEPAHLFGPVVGGGQPEELAVVLGALLRLPQAGVGRPEREVALGVALVQLE